MESQKLFLFAHQKNNCCKNLHKLKILVSLRTQTKTSICVNFKLQYNSQLAVNVLICGIYTKKGNTKSYLSSDLSILLTILVATASSSCKGIVVSYALMGVIQFSGRRFYTRSIWVKFSLLKVSHIFLHIFQLIKIQQFL